MSFDQRKNQVLAELQDLEKDRSRAGGIDPQVRSLVERVNRHKDYVTTSSCSGRITIFGNKPIDEKHKGGEWLFITHELITDQEQIVKILEEYKERCGTGELDDPQLTLRFEPFILAVECRNAETAGRNIINLGREAGFRESGLTINSSNRVMAAIRCSLRLEVPLLFMSHWKNYLQFLLQACNSKFQENLLRAQKFEQLFEQLEQPITQQESCLQWQSLVGSQSWHDVLCRWGHCACVVQDDLYVFGGYGGGGNAHQRLNDLLVISLQSKDSVLWMKQSNQDSWPQCRMGASFTAIDNYIYLLGGRTNPEMPLQDVWRFCIQTRTWQLLKIQGDEFTGRHRHSAVAYKSLIVVFGGCGKQGATNDLHVLNTQNLTWQLIPTQNSNAPPPSKSHAACVVGNKMFVYGGRRSYEDVKNNLHIFCLDTFQWLPCLKQDLHKQQNWPPHCFSHSLTSYLDRYAVLIGGVGYGSKSGGDIYVLDTKDDKFQWQFVDSEAPQELFPLRHTTCSWKDKVIAIGGGAFCFSFGTCFGDSYVLSGLHMYLKQLDYKSTETASFRVQKLQAKIVKDCLKKLGWLNQKMKVSVDGDWVYFPLTQLGTKQLSQIQQLQLPDSKLPLLDTIKEYIQQDDGVCEENVQHQATKILKNPKQKLGEAVENFVRGLNGLEESQIQEMMKFVPQRWEQVGDLVLLPNNSFSQGCWQIEKTNLWADICLALGCKRLGIQHPIANTGTRDSQVDMLVGEDAWVTHKENSIFYRFDASKCMFSSGNVSEKCRIAKLNLKGKVVVDLFAGIGYYTLPALVHAGGDYVYACEWNPAAIQALRLNVELNKVSDKCSILQGDCRIVAPKGVADIVFLGLIPSSEMAWKTAVQALKCTGGTLFVHNDVKDSELEEWARNSLEQFQILANQEFEQEMKASIQHTEFVKWYAPHIKHMVIQICIRPKLGKLQKICEERKPVVLSGYDLGDCLETFKAEQLIQRPGMENKLVSVHVCGEQQGRMDFVTRNFQFKTMNFKEFIGRCSGIGGPWNKLLDSEKEFYYLRSIGENPRKEAANLKQSFPQLFGDVKMPEWIPQDEKILHSSVLRVSSPGLSLWTHYDVMDNILIQIQGTKRVRLWHPSQYPNLYIKGSSSEVVNVDNPDITRFPLFCKAEHMDVELKEGEMLFIPALWFHNVKSQTYSVSINVFWKHLDQSYYQTKDLYGNKDLVAAEEAEKHMEIATNALQRLPQYYQHFYATKLYSQLQQKFDL